MCYCRVSTLFCWFTVLGCRVIGFASTEEKCEWLVKELGFDSAGNYKTVDIAEFLKENAPNGIDCYFDNVGGQISSIIMSQMNPYGKIAVCGAISSYNETDHENNKGTHLNTFSMCEHVKYVLPLCTLL